MLRMCATLRALVSDLLSPRRLALLLEFGQKETDALAIIPHGQRVVAGLVAGSGAIHQGVEPPHVERQLGLRGGLAEFP